jgi:hypothetical protein
MFDRGQRGNVAGVRYLAVRREDGIGLERAAGDCAAVPPHEACGNVVVAGLEDHEQLAREGAEVHFAAHPARKWVIVWAVSDSSLVGTRQARRAG